MKERRRRREGSESERDRKKRQQQRLNTGGVMVPLDAAAVAASVFVLHGPIRVGEYGIWGWQGGG